MTDRKNIKLPEPLFNDLKADKGEYRSWPQYFRDELMGDDSEGTPDIDTDALNELLEATRTIEKRTNGIERQLEDMGPRR